MSNEYLLQLSADERFQMLMAEVIKKRPIIPNFDHRKDNTEEWKYNSALQQGFDLCLQQLGVKI